MACSTKRLIASGRVCLVFCPEIQLSKLANSLGGIRTWMGVAPTNGRPLPDFLVLDIDLAIKLLVLEISRPRKVLVTPNAA
jgi:hypothetical protein